MTAAQLLARLGVALALIAIGFAAAWFWQANAYGARLATQQSGYQADLTKIAAAGAAQASQALALQQAAESRTAASDAKYTKEKADALAENERLRRSVADGDRRLRIAGSCSSGGGNVSGTTSAAGLGDAGAVELSGAAGRTVFDIRSGIIADRKALKALQDHVRQNCDGKPSER